MSIWTYIVIAYVAFGLLAMYWVHSDSKRDDAMDEQHG